MLEEYGLSERFKTEAIMYKEYKLARVIAQYKDLYKIVTDTKELNAEISGKLRFEAEQSSDYPAVGDFVMIDEFEENSNSIIHKILTRKSIFSRAGIDKRNEEQIISTNIDIVFICMSLNNNYNLNRLERYLSITWDSGAKPVIILTKSDLADDIEEKIKEVEKISLYADVITTSIFEDNIVDKLSKFLSKGITAAFVGSSGVGKSSIINLLIDDKIIKTQEIGIADKGKHTTTRREIFKTKFGGVVVDTPGMREIGISYADTNTSFEDIEELAMKCKFSDCTHTNEPECKIREAIEEGIIDQRRYENYVKIKNESSYEGLTSKEIEIKKHERMFKEVGGIKNARNFIKNKNKRR